MLHKVLRHRFSEAGVRRTVLACNASPRAPCPSQRGPGRIPSSAAWERLGPLAVFLAPFVYFWPVTRMETFLGDGETFAAFLSPWIYLVEHWKSLSFPFWTPHLLGGFPLIADPHASTFHPTKLLFLLLPPLVAFNLAVLVSHAVGGLSAYALARWERQSREAALLAGLAWPLCGFLLGSQGQTSYSMTAVSIPLFLLALRFCHRRPGYGSIAAGAATIALLVAAGAPQMILFALFFGGLYALYLLLVENAQGGRRRFAACVLGVYALGLAVSAPQILPTAELKSLSVRDAISYEVFVGRSIGFDSLLIGLLSTKVVVPYSHPGGVAQIHLGPMIVLLALFGATLRPRSSRFWIGLALFSSLLYVGDQTPLARIMYLVPGYNMFRVAARAGVMLDLALVMLAARGVSVLAEPSRRIRPARRALTLAVGAAVYWVALHLGEQWLARILRESEGVTTAAAYPRWLVSVLTLYAIGFVSCGALLLCAAGSRATALVAVALTLPFFWQYRRWIFVAPMEKVEVLLERERLFGALLPELEDPSIPEFRVATGGAVMWLNYLRRWRNGDWRERYAAAGGPSVNLIHGVSSVSAHTPLIPEKHARLTGGMTTDGGIRRSDFFRSQAPDLLNVRYVLVPAELGFPPATFSDMELVRSSDCVTVYRNPRALGLAWAVESVVASSEEGFFEALEAGNTDFRSTVLLSAVGDDAAVAVGRYARPRSVEARYVTPNTIEVEIRAAGPQAAFVAMSLPLLPGWRAEAGSVRLPLVEVNGLFAGFRVPPGVDRVVLRYVPEAFWVGCGTALASALGYAAAARWDWLRLRCSA